MAGLRALRYKTLLTIRLNVLLMHMRCYSYHLNRMKGDATGDIAALEGGRDCGGGEGGRGAGVCGGGEGEVALRIVEGARVAVALGGGGEVTLG